MKQFRPLALILTFAFIAACDDSVTGVDTSSFQGCSVTAYQIGTTVSGTLTTSDCRLRIGSQVGGEFVDYYSFNLSATQNVTIDMTSNQVDSYLVLFNRSGDVVAFNDDGGTGLNARIVISLPAGNYVIGATTFWDNETGSYTLSSN
jgi:hypothetical protein